MVCNDIRIYHKYEGGIVMPNDDHERQIFLSHPHTNNGSFFLYNIK